MTKGEPTLVRITEKLPAFSSPELEVTGVTATACVRTTICDGLADGFRTIAVRECIGDRVPGAVAWNLYDIDAKFADVHSVDECVDYLNTVNSTRLAAE